MTTRFSRWLIPVIHTPRKRVYYVNAAGNDNNVGRSVTDAWQSIAAVNAADLLPGDTVRFAGEETFAGQLTPAYSGLPDPYITLSTYGEGRAIIDGSATTGALHLPLNCGYSYLRFENLDFAGAAGVNAVTVRAQSNYLYFYNCIFRDSAGGTYGMGFYAYENGTGETLHHITVDTCEASGNDASGIHIGSGLGSGGPHDCLIINSIAHDNGTSTSADHGIYVRHGVIVDGCTTYSNSAHGIKLNCEGVYDSPYTPIARNNVSYSNRFGIYVGNIGSIVYNNLCYGNYYAMRVDQQADNSLIYYNTLINSVAAGNGLVGFDGALVTGTVWRNNLFVQDAAVADEYIFHFVSGTLADLASGNDFDYNVYYHDAVVTHPLFYDTATRLWSAWTDAGEEAHGVHLDALPGFVTRYTDLHPADAGNLKALGVAIAGYTTDKDGNARGAPPTPGAYEEAAA